MKKIKMARGVTLSFEEGYNKYLENCCQRNLREGTINHYRQSYTAPRVRNHGGGLLFVYSCFSFMSEILLCLLHSFYVFPGGATKLFVKSTVETSHRAETTPDSSFGNRMFFRLH